MFSIIVIFEETLLPPKTAVTGFTLSFKTLFMLIIVLGLILLSIFILKSIKEIPVIYARRGKVEESSSLPIPMNPVGMVPIIFSIAFVSFPYLLSKLITQFQPMNTRLVGIANWIEANLNIYTQQP